jgi:predicted ATPase
VSGLEDEYLLSGERPKLIYVRAGAAREPRLEELLDRIRTDDRVSYKQFGAAGDLAELLADDLAVLLTERFAGSRQVAAPGRRPGTVPTPPTDIIGRQTEIAAVGALLRDPAVHLVTLTGPGGIGKTRLAVEVARLVAAGADGPDGVTFVDLSAARDAADWPGAVTAALGIRPEGAGPVLDLLVDRLQGRRLLLVLDNVEQLVEAAPDLGTLLAACPQLTVLVTSRIVLQLRGEHEVVLAPLATPPRELPADPQATGRSAAVQLLVARARQVRPGFALTPSNAAAVAELCLRLDGIPLALELAAAQLRLLTPATLLRRLGDQLGRSLDLVAGTVDVPDRQRTLRATIDWSYSLLGRPEQTLLARLSVFSGAWTVAASEAVGAVDDDLDAFDTLASLVGQSLVRTDDSDPEEPRFRMLDTVRAYARERLAACGEVDATEQRLVRYLLDLVAAVRDDLQGAEHRGAAQRLDRERDEILSAMDWALRSDDAGTVGLLVTPLFTYWWSRGLLPMTLEAAHRAAGLPSAGHLTPYASALLLGARGVGMVAVGQMVEAEPFLRATVDAARQLGNVRLGAYALMSLGSALASRDVEEAGRRLDEAVDGFRSTGDSWGLAVTLSSRGVLALAAGDASGALELHTRALAAAEVIDNDHLKAQLLDMLGLDALATGDLDGAGRHYAAAAALHSLLLDYEGSAYCLSGLAGLALARNRADAAARLNGAAVHARAVVGAATWPGMAPLQEARDAAVGNALKPQALAEATEAGAAMQLADALAYGVAVTGPDRP